MATRSQLELAVVEYISWFNHDRLQETLGDVPPVEFETLYARRTETVAVNNNQNLQTQSPRNPSRLTRAFVRYSQSLHGFIYVH